MENGVIYVAGTWYNDFKIEEISERFLQRANQMKAASKENTISEKQQRIKELTFNNN